MPNGPAPAAEPIVAGETSRRRPITRLPTEPRNRTSSAAIVSELVTLQRIRTSCIVSQSMLSRRIESLIASVMGFRLDAAESDRKALFARAKAFRLAVEGGGEVPMHVETHAASALAAIAPLVLASADARKPFDRQRDLVEKRMADLAAQLPVASFVAGVRGLGMMGLAVIAAEAGIPIGDYRTVSGLWKRLGLAVIDGRRQRRVTGEAAIEQGYSPRRRAELWAFCQDRMFRAQWAGDRDEDGNACSKSKKPVVVPAHALGPYGEVYGRRRAQTLPRMVETGHLPAKDPAKWSKARCRSDATRIMTKALLRDLWVAWRAAK